jgi:hypothetical protein
VPWARSAMSFERALDVRQVVHDALNTRVRYRLGGKRQRQFTLQAHTLSKQLKLRRGVDVECIARGGHVAHSEGHRGGRRSRGQGWILVDEEDVTGRAAALS